MYIRSPSISPNKYQLFILLLWNTSINVNSTKPPRFVNTLPGPTLADRTVNPITIYIHNSFYFRGKYKCRPVHPVTPCDRSVHSTLGHDRRRHDSRAEDDATAISSSYKRNNERQMNSGPLESSSCWVGAACHHCLYGLGCMLPRCAKARKLRLKLNRLVFKKYWEWWWFFYMIYSNFIYSLRNVVFIKIYMSFLCVSIRYLLWKYMLTRASLRHCIWNIVIANVVNFIIIEYSEAVHANSHIQQHVRYQNEILK